MYFREINWSMDDTAPTVQAAQDAVGVAAATAQLGQMRIAHLH